MRTETSLILTRRKLLPTKKREITKFVIGPGTARYAKLDQPYYFDKKAKKSVADPTGKQHGSALTVEVVMSEEAAAPIIAKCKDVAEAAGLDLDEVKNWPFSKEKDKDTKKPTGNIVFKLKKYALNKEGTPNKVLFVDSKLKPIPRGFRLTSGSTIRVNGYFSPFEELGGGVSLRLDSVQVLKYVERSGSTDGFTAEDDGYSCEGGEFNDNNEDTDADTETAANNTETNTDF